MSETIFDNTTTASTLPSPLPRRMLRNRTRGILMVVIGASLWGLSGTAAQQLFQSDGFSPGWLVSTRMTLSGLMLLMLVGGGTRGSQIFQIWKSAAGIFHLLVFSILGLLAVQYTYFAAIKAGNAATATFLQYLGPALITAWIAVRQRRWPTAREAVALVFSILGTFLLVTNGSVQEVVVPPTAIYWGILSAIALAFYTLYPPRLMKTYGAATMTGWSMLIGGLASSPFTQPWHMKGQHWSITSALLVTFVVLFGTLLAFYLYLNSLRYITPSETSLLACVEPLSAAGAAVFWLHTQLGVATVFGGFSILLTVVVLSLNPLRFRKARPST